MSRKLRRIFRELQMTKDQTEEYEWFDDEDIEEEEEEEEFDEDLVQGI